MSDVENVDVEQRRRRRHHSGRPRGLRMGSRAHRRAPCTSRWTNCRRVWRSSTRTRTCTSFAAPAAAPSGPAVARRNGYSAVNVPGGMDPGWKPASRMVSDNGLTGSPVTVTRNNARAAVPTPSSDPRAPSPRRPCCRSRVRRTRHGIPASNVNAALDRSGPGGRRGHGSDRELGRRRRQATLDAIATGQEAAGSSGEALVPISFVLVARPGGAPDISRDLHPRPCLGPVPAVGAAKIFRMRNISRVVHRGGRHGPAGRRRPLRRRDLRAARRRGAAAACRCWPKTSATTPTPSPGSFW